MDYKLIYTQYNNTYKKIQHSKPKKEYVNMKSIVKLFVIFAILDLDNKKILDINSKLADISTKYNKFNNIKIKDIINHKSGLDNEWVIIDKHGKYKPSSLQMNYYKSKDIYTYVTKLKQKFKYGTFHYNNYTYDILGQIIYDITGKYIDKYLENNLLKSIKYTWFKINGKPVCSFGMGIYAPHLPKLLKRLHKMSGIFIKYANKYPNRVMQKKHKCVTFYGHSGSGGQFLYMNKKFISCRFAYDDPDELPENEQMTYEEFFDWVIYNK